MKANLELTCTITAMFDKHTQTSASLVWKWREKPLCVSMRKLVKCVAVSSLLVSRPLREMCVA